MTQKLPATPGQTIGPFFGFSLPYEGGEDLVNRTHPAALRLHGTVFDGAGEPIPDAVIEIWQADEHGVISQSPGSINRDGYTFTGFGRAAADAVGNYQFTTVEPGAGDGGAVPFFAVAFFCRGLLGKLHTRIYLPECDVESDPFLSSLDSHRRASVIASREPDGSLLFNLRVQGDEETVFLDFD
ncbi:MAG: protocatechuate 3,4-dioxygenase subunit alpha [Lacisediminihabitans sp.]